MKMTRILLTLAVLALGAAPSTALALETCTKGQGYSDCEVYVHPTISQAIAKRQNCTQWCWAACIEMVFATNGYCVKQEKLVEKIYGKKRPNLPATPAKLVEAINGTHQDERDEARFQATGREIRSLKEAIDELRDGHPIIIGSHGHATVLKRLKYRINDKKEITQILDISVVDPWPDTKSVRHYSAAEWNKRITMIKVRTKQNRKSTKTKCPGKS